MMMMLMMMMMMMMMLMLMMMLMMMMIACFAVSGLISLSLPQGSGDFGRMPGQSL